VSDNPLAPAWLAVPVDANALPEHVWSRNARRTTSGELEIAGVSASALVAEFGTPVYVVDEADARSRAAGIREIFERELAAVGSTARVYYAGKAFLCTEVARWVTDAGLGIDVASGGELAVALAAGVDPAVLGFHGNNKSAAELDRAVRVGVGAIVIDSVVEIERVAEAATRHDRVQPVRLRINSGVHASTHEYLATAREDQKFGIPIADAPDAVARIRSHDSLTFLGVHSHIGSQIFETHGFAESARRLLALHARLLETGPVPELNLGGGFGIAYTNADEPLSIEDVARTFAVTVATAAADLGIPLPVIAFEPGRSVIGPSTTTLYTVGTVKDVLVALPEAVPALEGLEGGAAVRRYVSVDGGMSDNIRPSLYSADYSVRLANRVSVAEPALVRVAGKHCESGDIVVHSDYLPGDVAPGDVVGVPATGAYGWAMSSNYNYLPRPPVVAVADGRARLIVRGETEEDLLSRDVGAARAGAGGPR
jgi:diaminopimelate decarboxylase